MLPTPTATSVPRPRRSAYLPRIRLDRWRPGEPPAVATFDATIGAHLIVPGCRLMETAYGGRWLSLPRRPVPGFTDEWEDLILVSPALREAIRRAAQAVAAAPIPEVEP